MNAPTVVLVDTGPFVALVGEDDGAHQSCLETLANLPRRTSLVTTLPALTEAFYLVSRAAVGCERLFDLLSALDVALVAIGAGHMHRLRALMRQYHDLPMDFADATIVAAAEELKVKTVFTLDRRGFQTYRPSHVKRLTIIP